MPILFGVSLSGNGGINFSINSIDYFKELGINCVELLPEGMTWHKLVYTGDSSHQDLDKTSGKEREVRGSIKLMSRSLMVLVGK